MSGLFDKIKQASGLFSSPLPKIDIDGKGENGRPMKFPYTFTAKIAQFPYSLYFQQNWLYKYWLIACVVTFPVFWKIQRMGNTPNNVKNWEEIRRRDFSGVRQHH